MASGWEVYTKGVMDSSNKHGQLCFIGSKDDGVKWAENLSDNPDHAAWINAFGGNSDQDIKAAIATVGKTLSDLRSGRCQDERLVNIEGFKIGSIKFTFVRCREDEEDKIPPTNYVFMFNSISSEEKFHLYIGFSNKCAMVAIFNGPRHEHECGEKRMMQLIAYLRSTE